MALDEERTKQAYEALLKYLSVSMRSEKECRQKLYDKGFHKGEVEYAIDKAKRYRFIDDAEYARTFVSYNVKKYGSKKLEYKLIFEKGVDAKLVKNILEDAICEDDELARCSEFAEKFFARKHLSPKNKEDVKKAAAFLYQKGFEWDVIKAVLDNTDDSYDD